MLENINPIADLYDASRLTFAPSRSPDRIAIQTCRSIQGHRDRLWLGVPEKGNCGDPEDANQAP
jgi:hypothetical protein